MKKILSLILVLMLVFALSLFALTSCKPDEPEVPDNGETEVDEDLQAAYDYIKLTYKTLNSTPKSYEVIKNVPVGEKTYLPSRWIIDGESRP